MAQRKTPSTAPSKTGSVPPRDKTGKPGKLAFGWRDARPPGLEPVAPRPRKPGKSIVNQKQTPWGLIITTVVLIAFAAVIVGWRCRDPARTRRTGAEGQRPDQPVLRPEIAAAKQIKGVIYKQEPNHNHVAGTVKYDTQPADRRQPQPVLGRLHRHRLHQRDRQRERRAHARARRRVDHLQPEDRAAADIDDADEAVAGHRPDGAVALRRA